MTTLQRHLQAAQGYVELGLLPDAIVALDQIEPAEQDDWMVLEQRVHIYRALEEWKKLEVCAAKLCRVKSADAYSWINLADAIRQQDDVECVKAVLIKALQRFPEHAGVYLGLASYEALLGNLESARAQLTEAIRLDPTCRGMALDDPDLSALHGELN